MIERDSSYVTAVKILDVEKRYRQGPKHYVSRIRSVVQELAFRCFQVYVIQVTWTQPSNTFVIYRRYAQFFDLQCKLLDLFAEAPTPTNQMKSQCRQIPFLPGKIIFGRSQIREVALERKHTLNIYCQVTIFILCFLFVRLASDVDFASRTNLSIASSSAILSTLSRRREKSIPIAFSTTKACNQRQHRYQPTGASAHLSLHRRFHCCR